MCLLSWTCYKLYSLFLCHYAWMFGCVLKYVDLVLYSIRITKSLHWVSDATQKLTFEYFPLKIKLYQDSVPPRQIVKYLYLHIYDIYLHASTATLNRDIVILVWYEARNFCRQQYVINQQWCTWECWICLWKFVLWCSYYQKITQESMNHDLTI